MEWSRLWLSLGAEGSDGLATANPTAGRRAGLDFGGSKGSLAKPHACEVRPPKPGRGLSGMRVLAAFFCLDLSPTALPQSSVRNPHMLGGVSRTQPARLTVPEHCASLIPVPLLSLLRKSPLEDGGHEDLQSAVGVPAPGSGARREGRGSLQVGVPGRGRAQGRRLGRVTPFWSSGGRWEKEESQVKRKEAGGGNLPAGCVQSEDGNPRVFITSYCCHRRDCG